MIIPFLFVIQSIAHSQSVTITGQAEDRRKGLTVIATSVIQTIQISDTVKMDSNFKKEEAKYDEKNQLSASTKLGYMPLFVVYRYLLVEMIQELRLSTLLSFRKAEIKPVLQRMNMENVQNAGLTLLLSYPSPIKK
jgi:hypothetical protein